MSKKPYPKDAAFDAWVASLPEKHWAKYDLSACRLGWEANRDAARYRWLRDEQATIVYKRKQDGEWEPLVDTCSTSIRSASLDNAIDAAMSAEEGK